MNIVKAVVVCLVLVLIMAAGSVSRATPPQQKCIAEHLPDVNLCDCSQGTCTLVTIVTGIQDAGNCDTQDGPCHFGFWSITTDCPGSCLDGQKTGTNAAVACTDILRINQRCGDQNSMVGQLGMFCHNCL